MLDAIAFQSCEVIEAMQQDAPHEINEIYVDGGVVESDLLMQIQADLSGIKVTRPRMREATALGAAIAAGVGVGLWTRAEEAFEGREERDGVDGFEGRIGGDERGERMGVWKDAVRKCF